MKYKDVSLELEKASQQFQRLINVLSERSFLKEPDEIAARRISAQICRCADSSVELALSIAAGTKKLPPYANFQAFKLAAKNGLTLESDIQENLQACYCQKQKLLDASSRTFSYSIQSLIDYCNSLLPLFENFLANAQRWQQSPPKKDFIRRIIPFSKK